MLNSEIKVTVCCAVFNHEKYLEQALLGMINQITDFRYEILINDDVSTDNSRKILLEYQKKYPDLIRLIFQKENQYSNGKRIFADILVPHAKGKYLAICEGDDYWTDNYKLQKQVDIMENHPNCAFCVHKVRDVDKNGNKLKGTYPLEALKSGEITQEKFTTMLFAPCRYWFHTSSFMLHSEALQRFNGRYPEFMQVAGVGDVPLTWLVALDGNVYYIDEEMSCYRRDIDGSWSNKMQTREYRRKSTEKHLKSLIAYNNYTNKNFDNLISYDIINTEFECLKLNNQFFKMRQKKYAEQYKLLAFKEKIKYFIAFILPFSEKLQEFFKQRKKKNNA